MGSGSAARAAGATTRRTAKQASVGASTCAQATDDHLVGERSGRSGKLLTGLLRPLRPGPLSLRAQRKGRKKGTAAHARPTSSLRPSVAGASPGRSPQGRARKCSPASAMLARLAVTFLAPRKLGYRDYAPASLLARAGWRAPRAYAPCVGRPRRPSRGAPPAPLPLCRLCCSGGGYGSSPTSPLLNLGGFPCAWPAHRRTGRRARRGARGIRAGAHSGQGHAVWATAGRSTKMRGNRRTPPAPPALTAFGNLPRPRHPGGRGGVPPSPRRCF